MVGQWLIHMLQSEHSLVVRSGFSAYFAMTASKTEFGPTRILDSGWSLLLPGEGLLPEDLALHVYGANEDIRYMISKPSLPSMSLRSNNT